jgi:hypothetical protein
MNLFLGESAHKRIKVAVHCLAMLVAGNFALAQSLVTIPTDGSLLINQSAFQSNSFTDENWTGWNVYPTLDQVVYSVVADSEHGLVYAGGSFTSMGQTLANHVAVWNGAVWKNMGGGMNSSVSALVMDKAGNLYAGGAFTMAGGIAASYIARWSGGHWVPLGSGLNGGVNALAVDTDGHLYAGGNFSMAGGTNVHGISVAVWNGQSWSALGSDVLANGFSRSVNALAFDHNGTLYAGGYFTNIGGIAVGHVAKWNGGTWAALGAGVNGIPFALATDASGKLYAGGALTNANGVAVNNVAKWDGNVWSAVGQGVSGVVNALTTDKLGKIYAGESYDSNQANVAIWNGTNWEATLTGLNNSVWALSVDASDNIYVGGTFTKADNTNVYNIALWNENKWHALPDINTASLGVNSTINALNLDKNGNLFAGGDFTSAGGLTANHVAKWDGEKWLTLGSGLDGPVDAMAFDQANNLYVGGSFSHAGGLPANNIARWDGYNWTALGSGVNAGVSSLVIDKDNHIFVGGGFTVAGNQPANYIAMWDGMTWTQVGGGLDNSVSALALDSNGNLYVGGFLPVFSYYIGAPFGNTHAAGWNGSVWYSLPDIGHISALATDPAGMLYAGGNGVMSKLTGSGWVTLGSGLDGAICPTCPPSVNTLIFDSAGDLYAGGSFNSSGGLPLSCIATWNGSGWTALGSGLNGAVNSLALDKRGNLFAGGDFATAGTVYSPNLAVAKVAPRMGVLNSAGTFLINGQGTLDFGTTPLRSPVINSLILTNIFTQAEIVSSFSILGTNAADFKIESITGRPFENFRRVVIVTIEFEPKTSGSRSAILQIRNNGDFDDPFIIALTGASKARATFPRASAATKTISIEHTLSETNAPYLTSSSIPMINGLVNRNDGKTDVFFSGIPGDNYVVQASTDLINWFNFSTNTCGTNGICVATSKNTGSRCFFRVLIRENGRPLLLTR